MQFKSLLKLQLLIFTILGIALFSGFVNGQASKEVISSKAIEFIQTRVFSEPLKSNQISSGLPIRLVIPKIKVDINLEQVGITSQGAVGVAKSRANGAWFNLGPRPGASGNAVITGHFGYFKNGTVGVFNNLYKLKQGDKIYVEDDRGVMISFVVREIKKYDPKDEALDVFSSSDGKSHLNLITCEGFWDKASKSYSKRLVVFADKE